MKNIFITVMILVLTLSAQKINAQRVNVSTSSAATPGPPFTLSFDCRLQSQGFPEDVNILRKQNDSIAWAPSRNQKATSIFMEYGDGTFGFNSRGTHDYNKNIITYPLLTKSSGLYDDDKRPPRHTLNKLATTGLTVADAGAPAAGHARGVMSPAVLSAASNITITPSINSVLAGDTMVYVVTYRLLPKTVANNPSIRFSYNNIAAFYPVTNPTNPLFFESLSAPQVRMYYGETATVGTSPKAGFSHGLNFSTLKADSNEHHIFITLVPDSTLGSNNVDLRGAIKVEADLMMGTTVSESASTQLDAGMLSHDPNYINISPACNLLPKAGKTLTFNVHCQNEGLGYAKAVIMKIGLPPGIGLQYIRERGKFYSKAPYNRRAEWSFEDPDSLVVTFNLVADTNPQHTLRGIHNNAGWKRDSATMADAWFSIPATNSMPDTLIAAANIYFQNYNNSINPAVTTNTAMAKFAVCCDCNKPKKKNRLWRWLFITRCG